MSPSLTPLTPCEGRDCDLSCLRPQRPAQRRHVVGVTFEINWPTGGKRRFADGGLRIREEKGFAGSLFLSSASYHLHTHMHAHTRPLRYGYTRTDPHACTDSEHGYVDTCTPIFSSQRPLLRQCSQVSHASSRSQVAGDAVSLTPLSKEPSWCLTVIQAAPREKPSHV